MTRAINRDVNKVVSTRTVSVMGHARLRARTRLTLLGACFALPILLIVMRLGDLALLRNNDGAMTAAKLPPVTTRIAQEKPQYRGDILDRNGEILATSLKTHSVYADPSLIIEDEVVARELAALLPNKDKAELQKKLGRKGRFVWLARGVSPTIAQQVNDLGVPGLGLRQEYQRFYPKGSLTSHMVGYAGIDGDGLAGIEGAYDDVLRGHDAALSLSLDVRLQNAAYNAVSKAMKRFEAKAGMAVVMDVRSQEVLAAVSLPDYDPHKPGQSDANARFNRFMQGSYELGSTFKLFSTAAFLERVDANLGRRLDATKPLSSGRFMISDYHAQKRALTVPEVFMHSSNIGVALMAQEMGDQALRSSYKKFGFFDVLNANYIEKSNPIYPKTWRPVNSLTASFGHGIAVSPMHVAYATAGIMNDGVAGPIQLLKAGQGRSKVMNRMVSRQVADQMRGLMRLTVKEGTGSKADVAGYSVGGKTGSAEKPGKGGYQRDKLLSSFLGVYPMTDPKYLVYVIVDEPKPQKHSYGYATGGWVAAPAVQEIINDINRITMFPPVSQAQDMALVEPLYRHLKDANPVHKVSHDGR